MLCYQMAFQPGRQIEDNEDDPKQLSLLGF